ncbi:MAG: site-2 protease family protein [Synechococcales cyanobacterium CRU_2_2]|nr:site-2 protease family protein [Synechococcales cyanobacterium CRU_2_2]
MVAGNATTLLISLVALGAIAWGYVRGRAYGKLGILAWLQSVLLMAPWLLFFALFSFGIYLNFVAVLLLFVLATAAYIYVGRQMRTLGQNELIRQRLERLLENSATEQAAQNEDKTGAPAQASNTSSAQTAIAELNPIPAEDLAAIQEIFGIDTFFSTETIPYQEGAIFKGNLRGEPVETLKRLEARLEQRLGDRYRLYLINGPEDRPVVIALPTQNEPKPASTGQWLLAAVLFIATFVTCLERGGLQSNFDIFAQPERWTETLPIGLSLMAILVVHEAGHWLMARRHDVRLGPSFLLPAWQLGSFGGLTRIESVLPNRSVLFDIAFAGPAAGGVLSLLFLLLGLGLSSQPGPLAGSLAIPAEILQGSMLVGTLARTILGDTLQAATIQIHPFVVVGWLGLVITALNLVPAGQLDGGRMVQAVYGRKLAGRSTLISLVGLAIFSLANPVALYWSVLVLFLQRQPERPSQNELTEPDDARAALCLLALFLTLTVLLPLSPALAGRLGIGLETSPLLF